MQISTVAVIGTGVIGTGWVARFLANGLKVIAYDPAPGFEDALLSKLDSLWPTLERNGMSSQATVENLSCVKSMQEACANAHWIQENTPEDIEVKRKIHQAIESCCSADAIIASSSSGLLPTDIQSVYQNPSRMIIGHPFNPVYLLPLVEVVGGKHTHPDIIETAKKFYASLQMQPLHVRKEIEGYLSDRLQEALWREILHLVNDDIATTQELDDAIIYGPGLRWALMGTCLTFHLAGGEQGMQHMLEQFGPSLKLPWTKLAAPELTPRLINKMVEGTAQQANSQSIQSLESLRDDCLIDVMQALAKFNIGAGKIKAKKQP